MLILERELESTKTFEAIYYGETKFAEINNPLLEEYEKKFIVYFTTWIEFSTILIINIFYLFFVF